VEYDVDFQGMPPCEGWDKEYTPQWDWDGPHEKTMVDDERHWQVTYTSPGIFTIRVLAGGSILCDGDKECGSPVWADDWIEKDVWIIKVDLDIDSDYDGDIDDTDDAIEVSEGGAVGLNNDDDDNDDNVDGAETGTVSRENDLVEIGLAIAPSLNTGEVKLEATQGSSNIEVWENATKGTKVTLPKTWNLATDTVPSTLYVEGDISSGSGRDVELRLSYIRNAST